MRSRALFIAALAAVAAIALTGCSGATDALAGNGAPAGSERPQGLFEFQTTSYSAEGELTVRIPEGLIAAAGSDFDEVLVTEIRATPRELEGSKYCAIDLSLDYADGAVDKILSDGIALEDAGRGTVRSSYPFSTYYGLFPMSEFEESPTDNGIWVSEDLATAVAVLNCAENPMDEDASIEIRFESRDAEGVQRDFARVNLTVMKSGTIGVVEAAVPHFVLDSQGTWIVD